MPPLPRGTCPDCGADVALRNDGALREHQDQDRAGKKCTGSSKPPVKKPIEGTRSVAEAIHAFTELANADLDVSMHCIGVAREVSLAVDSGPRSPTGGLLHEHIELVREVAGRTGGRLWLSSEDARLCVLYPADDPKGPVGADGSQGAVKDERRRARGEVPV